MNRILTEHPLALETLLGDVLFKSLDPKQPSVETQDTSQKREPVFLGSYNKRILFIVNEQSHVFFAPEDEKAFLKTLQALNLNLEDVAVLNTCNTDVSTYEELKDTFKPREMIYLDCPNTILPGTHELTKNEIINLDQMKILHSDSFSAMLNDLEKKKQFWFSIKKMFPSHG